MSNLERAMNCSLCGKRVEGGTVSPTKVVNRKRGGKPLLEERNKARKVGRLENGSRPQGKENRGGSRQNGKDCG